MVFDNFHNLVLNILEGNQLDSRTELHLCQLLDQNIITSNECELYTQQGLLEAASEAHDRLLHIRSEVLMLIFDICNN